MADLPTDTVTFLLTDIEGSTRLWEAHPEPMRAALARHDALAAAVIVEHNGALVKSRGEGDSLFAVFSHAADALAAACALQQALLAEAWPPETPLRVRIALHSGAADHRDGDYYGPAVNRCARLRAVAHGGQILLSQATHDLASTALPEGASLRDLGLHRLKDLQQPEHLFQLLHPALPADFPPLRSLEAYRHNMPAQLTSFIGREQEIAEVKGLLQDTRLLTLTGAGGCGKTRLALQVAADLIEEYADGVWLVELAALADPDLVPQAVAAALGVREEPGRPLVQTLEEFLRPRTLLLVLDNCEHLLSACAQLADSLLRRCPSLRIVASSREGLGIAGEQTYRVPSLSLPEERPTANDPRPSIDALLQYEAVRLFVDRAAAGQPHFTLTPQNAAAVAQVCRRLDGIPLAIELAAARVKILPVEQIAQRLDDRFRLLTGGSRTALPRQQTLRALIDWSYDLLTQAERSLLRRLSVFAGGWRLAAAEGVCAGKGVEEYEVLELLGPLVDKSLVVVEEEGEERRYRLLETIAEYARARLQECGEERTLWERHAAFFLAFAESGAAYDCLESEHGNLRAALARLRECGATEAASRLGSALWHFWLTRDHVMEGRRQMAALLALPGTEVSGELRAQVLFGAGLLAIFRGEYPQAREYYEELLAIQRTLGSQHGIAGALIKLGEVATVREEYAAARALLEEGLSIYRTLDQPVSVAGTLGRLGELARAEGDYRRAAQLYDEALSLVRDRGPHPQIEVAMGLHNRGHTALFLGDLEEARQFFIDSLTLWRELRTEWGRAGCLIGLAGIDGAECRPEKAARLLGAAISSLERIGCQLQTVDQAAYERYLAGARVQLDDAAFAAAWAEGRAMSLDQAIAFALEEA